MQVKRNELFKKHHHILYMASIILSLFVLFSGDNGNISALSYQNTQDVLFTFNPVVTIGISGELSINDLAPGSSSDSNIITIVAGTNDDNGYTLYTNVGSSTNNYTDLRISSSDDNNVFSTLSNPVANLNSFDNNKWGYSYCNATNNVNDCTNNNNWVYGSSTTGSTSTTTGYGILPLYNDSTHSNDIVLADTVTASETTLQFKIGAKASNTQASGVYTNTINFIGVPKVITTNYSLSYVDNSGEATNMPTSPIIGTTDQAYITLSDTIPQRNGRTFLGWCDVSTSNHICSGTVTQPGHIYALDTTNTSTTVSMYAIWSSIPINLYDTIASMSKGTQTISNIRAEITVPTSADRAQDTSNSGVYEYDSSVFGVSSDASNDRKIYYYRGVLENSVGSYGSDGSAVTYPNYVILSATGIKTTADTCWRIVRTTGSGGIKMIYNGTWTGSTCANATASTQVATSAFNGSMNQQVVRVGYSYNSAYAENSTIDRTLATLFGTNVSDFNTTSSDIKSYIEDNWFGSIGGYEGILETSAGYCGDRTVYNASNVLQAESLSIPQYSTSTTKYNFGALVRTASTDQPPSLTCATYSNGVTTVDRSKVDNYTVSGDASGNGRLSKPIALLTADECAFAGSGGGSNITPYHANAFLHSGSVFWLLSPEHRNSGGYVYEFLLFSDGHLDFNSVSSPAVGVRPAISLQEGTLATHGSGTATDPWVVTAP